MGDGLERRVPGKGNSMCEGSVDGRRMGSMRD